MSKITALAADAMALNLSLTGIKVEEVSEGSEAESRCEALLQDRLDVLIIDEQLRDGFSDRMKDRLKRHSGEPLIVYCPAFDEEDSNVDAYLSAVIKPAVGFEIRLV
ncbi:MAG: V-type ATP synthase subunit F [Candidatus Hydrogenedentes bacterium]|nr:V-type ATP synthase subunit F [Candidatus Hydrogenedentota bacterium]